MTSPTPENPTATTEEVVPGTTPVEEDYIRLPRDPKLLQQEIDRLEREDQGFAQIFGERVGRKAERKYTPEIKKRDAQIEALKFEKRQAEVALMTPDEIDKRFVEDPAFAKEYAELVHRKPEPEVLDETPVIQEAIEDIRDYALSQPNMTPEIVNSVLMRAMQGEFGDETVHWTIQTRRLQAAMFEEIQKHNSTPPPSTNAKFSKAGPDLSRGSQDSSHVVGFPSSVAEFRRLPMDEQRRLIATPEGKAELQRLLG